MPQSDPRRQRAGSWKPEAIYVCIPSKANSMELERYSSFSWPLFGFGFGVFLNIQTRINFTKKLAIFINFLRLIPIQDTSCLRKALSLRLLADVYSKNHKLLYTQQKAPRSLLPTFLQCIIFKIHFIFS